jgi:hypothetical protein
MSSIVDYFEIVLTVVIYRNESSNLFDDFGMALVIGNLEDLDLITIDLFKDPTELIYLTLYG